MDRFQKINSQELNLSFDFEILDFQNREFQITIHGLLREIKYSERFFEWFMEDLIYFLEQNKYQKRWDIGTIYLSGLSNLNISKEDLKHLINLLTTNVTNFDIKISN